MIASHVLNEGVDVPAASIAIILSGTGSTREYIQRLGRVLRKGNIENKQAILYEVVAEDTSEEGTMKMIVENKDAEGLEALLGEQVFLMCACYIYSGKLVGVDSTCVKLENAHIVYETGPWGEKTWKDAQKLPNDYHYVATGMVESFGKGK